MPPYKTLLIRPALVHDDVFHLQAYELGRRLLDLCAFNKKVVRQWERVAG
jgi:hypothetical protein